MVFSSIPAYLDPSNWQQQQNHQIIGSSSANPLLPPPPHPGPHPAPPHGGSPGSIRPGSMAERARLANIPMPEAALNCPRCESTNTKFCYFNNYSLSQPRHFCKTCRRYWTRGGALRNVPVGGGCRRNKRSKSSSRSKSPASSDRQTNNNNNNNVNSNNNNISSSTSSIPTNIGSAPNILGLASQLPPLRFMSPNLAQLTDNFTGDHMGLSNYGVGTTTNEMNFHGNLLGGGGGSILPSDGTSMEPWLLQQQVQQFPFFGGGLDQSSSPGNINYPFLGSESNFIAVGGTSHHHQAVRPKFSSSMLSQPAPPVKMEDNHPELNLSRQLLLGNMAGNNEQWNNSNTVNWTELSSFSSSSTSNPL